MVRKDFYVVADAFIAAYREGVEPFLAPSAFGIRRHAWRTALRAMIASLKQYANFDAGKFEVYVASRVPERAFEE